MVYTDNVFNSLQHYFNVLENTGSYSQKGTLSLLIYCFIHSAFNGGEFEKYLTDRDLITLNRLLSCLSKDSCIIQMPLSKDRIGKPKRYYIEDMYRSSENNHPRITEDQSTRILDTDV